MQTYHALTPVAASEPLPEQPSNRALAPTTAPDPEPTEPGEQPAAVVNTTIEELAREGARRMLERDLMRRMTAETRVLLIASHDPRSRRNRLEHFCGPQE